MGGDRPIPTATQQQAIETPERVLLVSAGAGTGKTRVLVERFIHLLATGQATVETIAALTFTEKAAAEMKERIRHECQSHAVAATGSPEEPFWLEQYAELEAARIGTIHGFCSRLLRTYPMEAGVDPQFSQLEGAPSLVLRHRVAHEAVEQALERAEAMEMAVQLGLGPLRRFLVQALGHSDRTARAAAHYDRPEAEQIAAWTAAAAERMFHQIDRVRRSPAFLESVAALPLLAGPDKDKAEQIRQALLGPLDRFIAAETFEAARSEQELITELLRNIGKLGSKSDPQVVEAKKHMLAIRERLKATDKLCERLKPGHDAAAFQLGRELARLADAARALYEAEKERFGLLDFEDLLIRTRQLVQTSPAVVRAFAAGTDAILVDEFQDTDRVQRDILFALAGIAESDGPPATESAGPRVFLVGDAKQSIYRFRGADVSVFTRTEQQVERSIHLETNFRSTRPLIDYFNQFFPKLMAPLDGVAWRDDEAKFLSIKPAKAAADRPSPAVELAVMAETEEKLSADEARRIEAAWIARRIQELVGGATSYRQIALLFRRGGSVGLYEEALTEAGIPALLESGGRFYRRQEIQDMINLLRVLVNRRDDLALVGWLRSPMVALSDPSLFWLADRREAAAIWDRLADPESLARLPEAERERAISAREILATFSRRMNHQPVAALIRALLDATGFEAILGTRRHGPQMILNLRRLVEMARSFDDGPAAGPGGFLTYLTELSDLGGYEPDAAAAGDDSDTVRLMTVHAAKGRQFPIVFLPDSSSYQRGGRWEPVIIDPDLGLGVKVRVDGEPKETVVRELIRVEEEDRELAERKRLLYVAMTRAEEQLILPGYRSGSDGRPDADSWFDWIRDAQGVETLDDLASNRLQIVTTIDPTDPAPSRPAPAGPTGPTGPDRDAIRAAMLRGDPLPAELADKATVDSDAVAAMLAPVPPAVRTDRVLPVTDLAELLLCPAAYQFDKLLPPAPRPEPSGGSAPPSALSGAALGSLVHEVLERWDFQNPEALAPILDERLDAEPALQAARDAYRHEADTLLNRFAAMPVVETLRQARSIQKEVPFLLNLDGHPIGGTIDLLFEDREGRLVIADYKTDRVAGAQVAIRAAEHTPQIQIYQLALARIMNVSEVSGLLLFLSPGEAVPLPGIAGTAAALAGRITGALENLAAGNFPRTEGAKRPCPHRDDCAGDACA